MTVVPPPASADEPGVDPRMSLFDHATRLLQEHPTGPLPDGGHPFPDEDTQHPASARRVDPFAADAMTRSLARFLEGDDTRVERLHHEIVGFDVVPATIEVAVGHIADLPGERFRSVGSWLVRHATDRRAALVGLALLIRGGRPEDIGMVRTICVLDYFGQMAAGAVRAMSARTADAVWLAERCTGPAREALIEELHHRADGARA